MACPRPDPAHAGAGHNGPAACAQRGDGVNRSIGTVSIEEDERSCMGERRLRGKEMNHYGGGDV